MAVALTHFFNHALGLYFLALMDSSRELLAFWSLDSFWCLLLVDMATALVGLYRRRGLNQPAWQWPQRASDLLIPFLMIQHYLGARWLPVASAKMGGCRL
jgi:hypothetical protein